MIGVPSKGRAGKSATLAALRGAEDIWVVCPEDEIEDYRVAYPWVTGIWGQTHPGVGMARQQLLTLARLYDTGPFWMLDDDITGAFARRKDGKFDRMDLGAMIFEMMEYFETDTLGQQRVALAGPNFRHRAWSGPGFEKDRHLRNFVWVNPEAPIDYWPHLKEDLDIVLQALTQGWATARTNLYAFDSPQMGTSQGGCRDDYDAGKLEEACRALVEKWPGVVELRIDPKTAQLTNRVNWKAARERWFAPA